MRKQLTAKKARVEDLMNMMHIEEFADSYPGQLSGGMKQRVALARALANEPELLLLDEPLGALDAFTRMHIQDELLDIKNTQKTSVLMITHDIDEAFNVGHDVVLLRQGGETVQTGTPEEILSDPKNQYVRDFIGADRAERNFAIKEVGGQQIVVDGDGRPAGILNR